MALKKSQRSLKKWTSQKWDYLSKGDKDKPRKKRGRYLPKSVRDSVRKSQKAATNRKKRAATKMGRAKASYGKKIARKVRRA